jgi:glycosyltransferase involved in cell wall biosynthesis
VTTSPAQPLRIALVHPFHWEDVRRGGERYFGDLAWYLARQGHRVDVITGTWGAPSVQTVDGVTVRRVRHFMKPRLQRRGLTPIDTFGLAALPTLRARRYDVVHAMTATSLLAARLARQRTLMTALGHPTPEQFGLRPLDRKIAALSFRMAHAVAAFSAASAAQTTVMFGRPCLVLPLGVRVHDFTPRLEAREGPPRLLFAGFPGDPRKGVDLALQAMRRVLDRYPDARLLLPGERAHHVRLHDALGADATRVLAATDDLGVLPMDAMPDLYRSATVSLLPSKWEALGISLVESLACGTPAVCSDDGGMPSIVSNDGVGTVVPTGDADALASGLLRTIELARTAGTAARCAEHARAWDWDSHVGPLHERTYRDLIS